MSFDGRHTPKLPIIMEFEAQYRLDKDSGSEWVSYIPSRSTVMSIALVHEKFLHEQCRLVTRLVSREVGSWECYHVSS